MKKQLLAFLTVMTMLPLFTMQAAAPVAARPTPPQVVGKAWYGMSSWYGDHWKGRKTACGGIFDPQALAAAHPYLPCGTWVRVTCIRTGRSEFARITDRGPYEEGREIDVTERVARRIGIEKFGVEKVKIEVVRAAK
jgi:rare lipoprotein A